MRTLRPVLFGLALVVLLGGCGGNETADQAESTSTPAPSTPSAGKIQDVDNEPVPDLTFETLGGESFDLANQDGRVLLLNFWATWCAPCRKEIPDLDALHSELNGKGLTVIGIALDRGGAEVVRPYVEKHDVGYPIVLDAEGNAESELGPIYGLPTTLVVNPDGEIIKRVLGIFPVSKIKPSLQDMLAEGESSSGTT